MVLNRDAVPGLVVLIILAAAWHYLILVFGGVGFFLFLLIRLIHWAGEQLAEDYALRRLVHPGDAQGHAAPLAFAARDLNFRALMAAGNLLRKSTRPRERLERDVRQCVAVPRIQQSAAWAAAPGRSHCTALLSPVVLNARPPPWSSLSLLVQTRSERY
jgi:hypothetical protein